MEYPPVVLPETLIPPRVTVVMPAWNRAHCIGVAIDSVFAQSFRDFELVVIDDGSRDDLEGAVARYRSDPRFRLIRIPHSGVAAARNTGIRVARGAFIAYLDTDNAWRPLFLEHVLAAVDAAGPECLIAYAVAQIHEEGPAPHPFPSKALGSPFRLRGMLAANLIDQNTVVHAKSCWTLVGGYDESLRRLVDWDFLARVTTRFDPVFVPEVLVDYRWGAEENAISRNEDLDEAHRTVRKKLDRHPKQATLQHDTVTYTWDDLPDATYENWVRAMNGPFDRENWRPYGYPCMLQIEPTSRCNLACPACPVGRDELGRPKRDMTPAEFSAIVDDMRRWLLFVVLWDWGEPFANPRLPDIVRYAEERNIRVVTSTNAHYLGNRDFVAEVLASGLSTLIVAIDSIHEEAYRVYRVGGHLERAIDGLRTVVDLKRQLGAKTLINLRMVAMRTNEKEVGTMRRLARSLGVDRFTVKTMNPSCGDVSMDAELVPKNPRLRRFEYRPGTWERIRIDGPCDRVFVMANVFSNGDVVPCCYDYDSTMKVGNVFETPLSQLWPSPEYRALRQRVHEARGGIPRCRNCHINFQLTRSGWFAESVDLTARRKPFWDPRRYLGF
jgi:radical SAM protein with 4Fe4S-binding SPASM domain